jgi:predicted CXXCH cytochrome family protein
MYSSFVVRSGRWADDGRVGIEPAACTTCHDAGPSALASQLDAAPAGLALCTTCGGPDLDRDIAGDHGAA